MMRAVSAKDLLPSRPWPLAPGYVKKLLFGGGLLIASAVAVGLALVSSVVRDARQLESDRAVWNAQTSVEVPALVQGTLSTRNFLVHSYKFDVRYVTEEGERNEKLEFTALTERDQSLEPMVRYEPNQPSRFALNWAVQLTESRVAWIVALAIGAIVLVAKLGKRGRAMIREARDAERLSIEGVPAICEVLSVDRQLGQKRISDGQDGYRFRFPEEFGGGEAEVVIPHRRGTALFVGDRGKMLVVVLRSDPRVFLPITSKLFPFAFDPSMRDQILERAASSGSPQ
ncbi:hypothetical protein AKJ09_00791 [Labilithrix luteola]|uniref:DUF3592 domain-containing protein n=1 Tax=Labilithrix luteola TaxID=1391654 RepID=A0A0K1PKS8_9BACT|nr:hypothetical protein [Labilithrix luteola]AKU94127.1 hypothetical protein AKJ09_00791 [Labilithrix luteola]